eukprot:COSAG06_NODE_41394_length_392_cov_0.593857_1_plen_71_part_01
MEYTHADQRRFAPLAVAHCAHAVALIASNETAVVLKGPLRTAGFEIKHQRGLGQTERPKLHRKIIKALRRC